jgi:hypothetical protein
VPDALFAVAWNGERRAYLLEVDNDTRSARRFLKKILAYIAALRTRRELFGFAAVTILVVCRDPLWLERYRAAVRPLGRTLPIFFAALPQLGPGTALDRVWRTAEEGVRYSLRDLPFLPYGEERGEPERLAIPQS